MALKKSTSAKSLRISVIVPAYEAAHYLLKSLPPLIELREAGLVDDVVVVDDCSPNSFTRDTAEELGATVICASENGGPGAARNLAASTSTSDLLWFVDADVVVHPNAVKRISGAFSDDNIHALFGSYDDNPPAPGFASQYKNLLHRYYHSRSDGQASTFWSGCGVVRREQFLSLGGFDTEQFKKPSVEDIELGYRIRAAGGLILLDPAFLCTHLKEWSLKEVVMTDVLKRAAPWSKLLATSPKIENNLNISVDERIRAGIAGLWALSMLVAMTGLFWPVSFYAFGLLTTTVVISNWELLMYFSVRRGFLFGLAALAFHQVYYIYSAATFSLVTLRHRFLAKPTVTT